MVINELWYSQLKHFFTTLPQPIRSGGDLLPLERLCIAANTRNGISLICKILVTLKKLEILPYIEKWAKELGALENEQHLGN